MKPAHRTKAISQGALLDILGGARSRTASDYQKADPTDLEDALSVGRSRVLAPERKLQAEMIIQAFRDLYPPKQPGKNRRAYESELEARDTALAWFRSRRASWATDFEVCCESLCLSPSLVREFVSRCQTEDIEPRFLQTWRAGSHYAQRQSKRPRALGARGRSPEEMMRSEDARRRPSAHTPFDAIEQVLRASR